MYYRFRELACVDAVKALRYLQKDLHDTIDHDNKKETAEVCYQLVYYMQCGRQEIITRKLSQVNNIGDSHIIHRVQEMPKLIGINSNYDINVRAVYGTRQAGVGYEYLKNNLLF